jgi:superfamily II DNA or RNA helicase
MTTKKTPRWYQREAHDEVMGALKAASNVNPVAAIVTGGGKSLLNAMLIETIAQTFQGARVVSLAPSMDLITQNIEESRDYWSHGLYSRLGVYCAGLGMKDRIHPYTFATPQSFARSAKKFGKIDFFIVDEAHTFNLDNKTTKSIVDAHPSARFIGLTATDFLMKGLKAVPLTQCGLFNAKVYDLTSGRNFNRLTREGYLSRIVSPSLRFPQIDTEGVKTKGGDFDEAELAKRAMQVTQECVNLALEHAPDRKHFMWFAVNIDHAKMIQHALVEAGESSVLIHGQLEKSERVDGIAEYKARKHRHVVSVAMLTTGFDAKFVDCLVVLRPTRSLVLWKQIVGRGLRPFETKDDCLVLDAGGNFARHGPINKEIGAGDSRAGLWECTDVEVKTPFPVKRPDGSSAPSREKSALRFPINSGDQSEFDLRVVLGLMDVDAPACGYLNDSIDLTCRQCGRPRQGFLTMRRPREPGAPRDPFSGDTYEIHDEESVVQKDEESLQVRQLPVMGASVAAEGQSVLNFTFETEYGPYKLRLDFDRTTADNKFFAFSRKFWEAATGRKLPNEAYRVLLQRETIAAPIDITLTKDNTNMVYITEIRWLRAEQLHSFRYDPKYAV